MRHYRLSHTRIASALVLAAALTLTAGTSADAAERPAKELFGAMERPADLNAPRDRLLQPRMPVGRARRCQSMAPIGRRCACRAIAIGAIRT